MWLFIFVFQIVNYFRFTPLYPDREFMLLVIVGLASYFQGIFDSLFLFLKRQLVARIPER